MMAFLFWGERTWEERASDRAFAEAEKSCVDGRPEPGWSALDAAGVQLSPWRNAEALADSLVRVLSDGKLWLELHQRSVKAQTEYFSWNAVANRYVEALGLEGAMQ